jgi:hypothetical protein
MANISVAEEMLKNFIQLNDPEQKSVLQLIKTFIANKNIEEIPPTIEAYNIEIKAALNRAKNGEFTSIESLKTEMVEW